MATARDMIRRALRLFNGITVGEPLSAEAASDGLATLNDMLATWSTERLITYVINRRVFALTPGTQLYTMGVGGNFNVVRPVRIEKASILLSGAEYPIEIVDYRQWQEFSDKALAGAPSAVWDNAGFPLRTLQFYPVPDAASSVVLYCWEPIAALALDDEVSFPPGYARAIRFNLAIDLAPEYQLPIDDAVIQVASDAKQWIKSLNVTTPLMSTDSALLQRQAAGFDIYEGL